MKVYLASRYSRRLELCEYRESLQALGIEVTSRWLHGLHEPAETVVTDHGPEASEKDRGRFALEDWEDLMAADCCISFTEPSRTGPTRGGRHVEFGGALAAKKRVIVVGHRENVFHCLPGVEFFESWSDALKMLSVPF